MRVMGAGVGHPYLSICYALVGVELVVRPSARVCMPVRGSG